MMNPAPGPDKDHLWLNLREVPYFRGLLRSVEERYYGQFTLPAPILDVGCGDGQFATTAFDHMVDVGLDPQRGALGEASLRHGYRTLVQAVGNSIPFENDSFGSAFSNSVLEHIPNVDSVLREISRTLKPEAPFVFCVPNQHFLSSLSIGGCFDRLGIKALGNSYRSFFNRIARHYHCDPPEVWQARLEGAGFRIERWWNYFSPAAMRVTEWGHYFGLPSLLIHKATRRWILVPTRWNLALTYRIVEPYYRQAPECPDGVCTFYVARCEKDQASKFRSEYA